MTREEAINCIKYGIIDGNYAVPLEIGKEALNMAIKALEQEPFINKPCVSSGVCEHDKQKVLDKIRAEIEKEIIPRNSDQYDHEAMWQNLGLRMALKVINKYKAESEG